MREILFRGKRKNNGEWVEGDIHKNTEFSKAHIHPSSERVMSFAVVPETVGQYTGLTDKNGRKIFEGDICRFKRFNDVHVGEIVFNVITASFAIWYQSIVGAYGEKATHKTLIYICDNIEVIGKLHDNPELIGGEENA